MEKIRILHVFGSLNRGGAETFIMNIYRNIDRSQYQFDFLVQTEIEGHYENEIKSYGGRIYRISSFKGINYFFYKKQLKDLFSDIYQDYAYIHCHVMSTSKMILKVAKKYDFKTISHSHISKYGPGNKLNIIFRKLVRLNFSKYADIKLACGVEAGKFYYKNNSFTVIENGIDFNVFENQSNQKTKIIGLVGRFNEQKNHKFIIEIFSELLKMDNSYKLVLIGDGELKDDIIEYSKKKSVYNDVEFTGSVSNVNEYLKKLDLFLMPSFMEGLPLVLVEAQLSKVRILASTNIPNEVKMSNFVHFKSLGDSAKSWAEEIIRLNNLKEEKVLHKKIEDYNIERVVEKYKEILGI